MCGDLSQRRRLLFRCLKADRRPELRLIQGANEDKVVEATEDVKAGGRGLGLMAYLIT